MPPFLDFIIKYWWITAIAAAAIILPAIWFVSVLLRNRRNERTRIRRMRRMAENGVTLTQNPVEPLSPKRKPKKKPRSFTLFFKIGNKNKPADNISGDESPVIAPNRETTIRLTRKTVAPSPVHALTYAPAPNAISAPGERYLTGAAMHIGTRKTQQDALYVSNPAESPVVDGAPALLCVVCDGMGGMEHGEAASKLAVDTLVSEFRAGFNAADIPDFFERTAEKADKLIYDLYGKGAGSGAGTTAVAVILAGDNLYWLSVGDSSIYILRDTEIVCVTRSHNFGLLLKRKVDSGEITARAAAENKDREALISYLGMGGLEMTDINRQPFALKQDDIILLCSDGITKSLSEQQIQNFTLDGIMESAMSCAQLLVRKAFECRKGAHQDNTSVIIIKYNK